MQVGRNAAVRRSLGVLVDPVHGDAAFALGGELVGSGQGLVDEAVRGDDAAGVLERRFHRDDERARIEVLQLRARGGRAAEHQEQGRERGLAKVLRGLVANHREGSSPDLPHTWTRLRRGSEMQTHRHREAFRSREPFRATDMRAHARSRRYSLRARSLLGRGRCAELATQVRKRPRTTDAMPSAPPIISSWNGRSASLNSAAVW